MRILTVHADWIEVEPRQKAIKDAEEIEQKKLRSEECLVVFTAVEARDEGAAARVAGKAAAEIEGVAKQVNTKRIVLYPYVHLTSAPSSPGVAHSVIVDIEGLLKKKGYSAVHAPFGWYKSFDLKAKGHPLSELSREIVAEPSGTSKAEDVVSGALKAEEAVRSAWYILSPGGELVPADRFDFKGYPKLRAFYGYEVAKVRGVTGEPPHSKLMKELELVDYEPGSDPGNLRFYPKGRLMKSLLERWVTQKVISYGGMEVETPIMYDYQHPALEKYLQRFPARQYVVESTKKKFFLRFSACFGQFLIAASSNISYKDLPLKLYELTRYSFRLEKAGELVALRRLRSFTMPDMHTMCADLETARQEFLSQFRLGADCMKDLGFSNEHYEMAFRCTEDFWRQNKDWVVGIAREHGRPMLVEMWNTRYAYFDPKFEFNFVDSLDKAAALTTVQIDHENGERFGITYTGRDGQKKNPFILHCSPSGAIERVLYALLENAHMAAKGGGVPGFPFWLSPVQVRLCPISDRFVADCEKLADELERHGFRVDIDDREETVPKKVRAAELEWVPLILVFGEKERVENKYQVRLRETGRQEKMSLEQLLAWMKKETEGKPAGKLPLPRLLSKRPIFVARK